MSSEERRRKVEQRTKRKKKQKRKRNLLSLMVLRVTNQFPAIICNLVTSWFILKVSPVSLPVFVCHLQMIVTCDSSSASTLIILESRWDFAPEGHSKFYIFWNKWLPPATVTSHTNHDTFLRQQCRMDTGKKMCEDHRWLQHQHVLALNR